MKFRMSSTLGLLAVGGFALAQSQIYEGTSALDVQGITVGSWGGGVISETTEAAFDGTASVRISTRNFFQGGTMMFGKGVDLTSAAGDKSNMLMFVLNVPQTTTSDGAAGGTRGGPGAGAGGGGSAGAGEDGPGGGGARGGGATGSQAAPAANMRVRVVITTSDNLKSEAYLDMRDVKGDARGWQRIGVPLAAINGFQRTNKNIKSMSFSADASTVIYVGQIGILNDTTPVYCEPTGPRELNIGSNQEVTFGATGTGGATPLTFMWDFNASDGVQIDAEGRVVKYRFRKAGVFTITLTARDIYGLKQPYSTTIKVTVN